MSDSYGVRDAACPLSTRGGGGAAKPAGKGFGWWTAHSACWRWSPRSTNARAWLDREAWREAFESAVRRECAQEGVLVLELLKDRHVAEDGHHLFDLWHKKQQA